MPGPPISQFSCRSGIQRCYGLPPGAVETHLRDQHGVTWFKSPQGCPSQTARILPLSTDQEEIKQAIQALVPAGGLTYSALGVLWGQRLLTPSWKSALRGGGAHPLDPDEVRKAIVLLTDGQDTYCGRDKHGCDDSPVGISRADACTAAKSRGTEIFVVTAMDPEYLKTNSGDLKPFGAALRACSSEDDCGFRSIPITDSGLI